MRTVKILAGLTGALIALLAVALFAVWLWVNPNDYKGRVEAAVKDATGRDLDLKGDIKLSVFPWVALELGPASLGNPPGFPAEPFLAFNHAAVRVSLFGLMERRLSTGRISLDGLDVRLLKNAQGVGNWQNFGKPRSPAAPAGSQSAGLPPQIAGIEITNGRVSYPGFTLEKINLAAGAVGAGDVPISLSLEADRGVAGERLTLNAKVDLHADSELKAIKLMAVNLSGLVARAGTESPVHWELTAPTIDVDLNAETIEVPEFAASYSSAHLTGKLQASKILDDLAVTGSVTLAPVVLKELAPRLGIALPKTRDPRALAQFAASSDFSYDAGGVRFNQLAVTLDDTHLKGDLAATGVPKVLKFDLTVDQIDVDRYLSPETPPAAPAPKAEPKTASGAPAMGSQLPDAQGTLVLGSVHFAPLDLSNVRLTLGSQSGVVHLYPVLAQIDGGSYSGNVTLDLRDATPALSLDEHLNGIDVARLMAGTSYKGKVSGRGTLNLKATAHGAQLPAVLATLNGHFDANLADGALEGVDVGYELSLAQALLKRSPEPARSSPARTKFDAFKLSAEIANGVAKISDLTISSPALRVTGGGSANLGNKAIDIQLLASVQSVPGTSVADIPLKVTGTYPDPTVRPDIEALAKAQVKQKLQDVLKKNLGGLFGK